MSSFYFTSESVTEGHPDKVADAVSDAVLDAALTVDPWARVACETFVTSRLAVVGGEVTMGADLDVESIVRDRIREIGYDGFDADFDASTIEVHNRIHAQSADIKAGVDRDFGAGDQGLMFAVPGASAIWSPPLWPRVCFTRALARAEDTLFFPWPT